MLGPVELAQVRQLGGTAGGLIDASTYAGYDRTGATDSAAAIQRAINDALVAGASEGPKPKVVLLRGMPTVASTLQVNARGLILAGDTMDGGVFLGFTGKGVLLQIGTETHPGDHYSAYYDGPQGVGLQNLTLWVPTAQQDTALANGAGSYGAGTTAVTDWYGGGVVLENVRIRNFDTGFAGMQSDVDRWDHTEFWNCKLGASIGARSDQLTATALYMITCDRAVDIDCVRGARFIGCQFVGNGAPGVNPIRIRAAGAVGAMGSAGIFFDDCWFEHLQGYAGAALEAFVEVAVGDALLSSDVHFRNPSILTGASGQTPRMQYLVKLGNADAVSVTNPNGPYWTNLSKLVLAVGATNPSIVLRTQSSPAAAAFGVQNSGTGSPVVLVEAAGALQVPDFQVRGAAGSTRTVGFYTGASPRWLLRASATAESGGNAGSDLELSARTDAGGALSFPLTITRATGQLILTYALRLVAAATGARPSAATAGAGATMYDSTLAKPIWSDGTTWRDATGTAV